MTYNQETNDEALELELHLLEERRMTAAIKEQEYKRRLSKYRDRRVRPRLLKEGDLVLRQDTAGGKLDPNREGPYVIGKEVQEGAYKLSIPEGTVLNKTWNDDNLKKYYV